MQVILDKLTVEEARVEVPEACPTCGTSPLDPDEGVILDGYDSVSYDGTLAPTGDPDLYAIDLDRTDDGDCDEALALVTTVRCGKCGLVLADANKEV